MAKKGCTIEWLSKDQIAISGVVDEYADFGELSVCAQQTLYADFSGVTRVNSSGIRNWIQSILRHKIQLVLKNCSSVIVDQFSMIPEFLGKNGFVESFYGHFHCSACAFEERQLFIMGKDVLPGQTQPLIALVKPCPQCNEQMEFDHNPEIYFAFLKVIKERMKTVS